MRRVLPLSILACLAASASGPFDELFPASEMRDRKTLDLKVIKRSRHAPAIARIDIEFTAFEWSGEIFRPTATVLAPDTLAPQYAGAGVVVSEPHGFDSDNPGRAFVEAAALMGMPALLIGQPNPGSRFGVKGEGNVMGYAQKKFLQTGDPRWIGYAWLAKTMLRGVTALQSIEGVRADRFVVSGGSKRGEASWIAIAADGRIAGAYPTCWNAGNLQKWLPLKAERWGMDYHARPGSDTIAPASVSTRKQIEELQSPRGRDYLAVTDPYEFRDRLLSKKVLFASGTNDHLFPAVSDRAFLPDMPEHIRVQLVANAGHTSSTSRHLTAWKMWLAHTFAGRDVPRIRASASPAASTLDVEARVDSKTRIEAVRVWSAGDDRGAYLKAAWTPSPMRLDQGVWRASIPAPQPFTAYFVEVEDDDPKTTPGVVTTGMMEYNRRRP